ncbi:MAG: bifunctional DNA primase/polymerase [Rhizobiales bacterium]|nr:bifunctional DNA primase/polymerase [Hyphomicrobiales bacterium]MBN9010634.1 bifunctional DNA primase/polymerase [Hyphomicrobiales bacterium]
MSTAGNSHADYAARLLERGMVGVPLLDGGKHLDLPAMGYDAVHREAMLKKLKELAFAGICFQLAQKPPSIDELGSWFRASGANIGIVGGVRNLLVLDFDHIGHFETWRNGHETLLRSTPIARTPSGFHVFLRSKAALPTSSLHFGMRRVGHAKALGGYVVASPSVLRNGSRYEWMPGQSPFDCEPAIVDGLSELSLAPVSPLKAGYDRLRGRGRFEDA